MYGAILNAGCRFADHRIGQSTTLTGRIIARHMDAFVNETITGDYDHCGQAVIYGDTDSTDSRSIIRTKKNGEEASCTIEELFLQGNVFWQEGDKEYSANRHIKIAHSDESNELQFVGYNYVYRHKVFNKPRFQITTANGKKVIVTGDHSVMVLQEGKLVEKKPMELVPGDKVITIL